MGPGDPGSVVKLVSGHASVGQLVSEVHDTKLVSRFGALSWRGDSAGRHVDLASSSIGQCWRPRRDLVGLVGRPDRSDRLDDHCATGPVRPVSRHARHQGPAITPELRSVSLSFRTSNLRTGNRRLDVPDVSTADGAARQTRLNVRWDASDPNDDDLRFTLKVRKEGWPNWIELTEEPITEKTFAWDTSSFPSGSYRIKLLPAIDRRIALPTP